MALLGDTSLHAECRQAGYALLFVHAVNPYGFSHLRRDKVNEDNVDLNRNFMDFDQPLPTNAPYAEVAPLLLPAHWPASDADQAALMKVVAERGMGWYQAAVSGGQYQDPGGLFFGGQRPTWSNTRCGAFWRALARTGRCCAGSISTPASGRGVMASRSTWGRTSPREIAKARAIWGAGVTSIYDGSSTSANLTGLAWRAVPQTLGSIDYAGIALEFGTLPLAEVLDALRGDPLAPPPPRGRREPARADQACGLAGVLRGCG